MHVEGVIKIPQTSPGGRPRGLPVPAPTNPKPGSSELACGSPSCTLTGGMLARRLLARPRAAHIPRRWLTNGDGEDAFLTSSVRVLMLANLHRRSAEARDLKDFGESLAILKKSSSSDSGAHQEQIKGLIARSLAKLGENDAARAFACGVAPPPSPAALKTPAAVERNEASKADFVFELHSPSRTTATRWFPVGPGRKKN